MPASTRARQTRHALYQHALYQSMLHTPTLHTHERGLDTPPPAGPGRCLAGAPA